MLLLILLLASGFGATTLLLKKNRRKKLMRKQAAAVLLSANAATFSKSPDFPTLKQLQATGATVGANSATDVGNGGVARYRHWRTRDRDHAKSETNIYGNVENDGSMAVADDTEASSDTSSLYYEPYKRIAPSSSKFLDGCSRASAKETRGRQI